MSMELFEENNCPIGGNHSVLVGKKCAYCMNCGQILIEYKNKKHFYRLMNPINEQHSQTNVVQDEN